MAQVFLEILAQVFFICYACWLCCCLRKGQWQLEKTLVSFLLLISTSKISKWWILEQFWSDIESFFLLLYTMILRIGNVHFKWSGVRSHRFPDKRFNYLLKINSTLPGDACKKFFTQTRPWQYHGCGINLTDAHGPRRRRGGRRYAKASNSSSSHH